MIRQMRDDMTVTPVMSRLLMAAVSSGVHLTIVFFALIGTGFVRMSILIFTHRVLLYRSRRAATLACRGSDIYRPVHDDVVCSRLYSCTRRPPIPRQGRVPSVVRGKGRSRRGWRKQQRGRIYHTRNSFHPHFRRRSLCGPSRVRP